MSTSLNRDARLFATAWNVWSLLEDSARHYADDRLLEVYREIPAAVHTTADRDQDVATTLYRAYHAAAGNTVRVAADQIRAHPDQYLALS